MDLISREQLHADIINIYNEAYDHSSSTVDAKAVPFLLILDKEPAAFDGMTNGEVIKAIFPSDTTETIETLVDGSFSTNSNTRQVIVYPMENGLAHAFRAEWWNAPYKGASES